MAGDSPALDHERQERTRHVAARQPCLVHAGHGIPNEVQHHQLAWTYDRAENGNVALVGEVDLPRDGGTFAVALAFGGSVPEAGLELAPASSTAVNDEASRPF
jgi:hypothetical protein